MEYTDNGIFGKAMEFIGEMESEIEGIDRNNKDILIFERKVIPIGNSTVILVLRFNSESELSSHIVIDSKSCLDVEIKSIRNLGVIISSDTQLLTPFFNAEISS